MAKPNRDSAEQRRVMVASLQAHLETVTQDENGLTFARGITAVANEMLDRADGQDGDSRKMKMAWAMIWLAIGVTVFAAIMITLSATGHIDSQAVAWVTGAMSTTSIWSATRIVMRHYFPRRVQTTE